MAHVPGLNEMELEKFRQQDADATANFEKFCSQCHGLPNPKTHARGEWAGVLWRMRQHMMTYKKKVPTQGELDRIFDLLVKNSL